MKPIVPENSTSIPMPALESEQSIPALAPPSPVASSDTPTLAEVLPPMPSWVMPLAHWFRVGFALFLLLSSLMGLAGCVAQAEVPWRDARQVLSTPVLEQVIAAQTTTDASERQTVAQQAKAWTIPGHQGQLVMLNYNTPQLCGALGCLYSGVWLKDKTQAQVVFSAYLQPTLPRSVALFQVHAEEPTGTPRPLPCIGVNQLAETNLRHSVYCLSGDYYRLVNSTMQQLPATE